MADATAVVVDPLEDEVTDEALDAEFDSGFTGTAPTVVTPPADDAAKEAEAAAKKAADDAAAAAAAVPKYRQVTEEEFADFQTASTLIKTLGADPAKRLDQAFGKVGGLERTLKELQAATPHGYAVEVTDDIVADISAEFPEIGAGTLKAFKVFASKLKGTAAPATVDPKVFEEQMRTVASDHMRTLQIEALREDYPNWLEIVGTKDSTTPYRKWLSEQPADYQTKLTSTDSALVISKSLQKFEAAQAAAKVIADKAAADALKNKTPSARQKLLESAVVVRGAGGTPPGKSEDDEFNEGFTKG